LTGRSPDRGRVSIWCRSRDLGEPRGAARSRSCIDSVPIVAVGASPAIVAGDRGRASTGCSRHGPDLGEHCGQTSWPCIDFAAPSSPLGPVADRGHASTSQPRAVPRDRSQIVAMHRCGAPGEQQGSDLDRRSRRCQPGSDAMPLVAEGAARRSWPAFVAMHRLGARGTASRPARRSRRPSRERSPRLAATGAEVFRWRLCTRGAAFVAMHRLGATGVASGPARRSWRPSRERSPRLAATDAEVFRWRLCTRRAGARARNRFVGRTRVTRRLVA